jgi:alkanesulfonate monooxygenase SsuD/methylene tetrahydromethanopterin reductase-like flavin-dependent oxidoreductase (luciferase family)
MKVGIDVHFQNTWDYLEREVRGELDTPPAAPDKTVFNEEIGLIVHAEELGFDSASIVEHHFGSYGMSGNPFQTLSYLAARTRRIELGTGVVVLPWHDPLRVAEGICLLDNLLGGRRLNIGFARGAAPQEFAAFGVDYGTARERMDEQLEIIRLALTQERFSFSGDFYDIPETTIRPRPLHADLTKNLMIAGASEETIRWAASTGAAQLHAAYNTPELVTQNTKIFNEVRSAHGWEPIAPTVAEPVFVSEDPALLKQAREWYRQFASSTMDHYGLLNHPNIRQRLEGKPAQEVDAIVEEVKEGVASAGTFGTPDQVLQRILALNESVGGISHLLMYVRFGEMPISVAKQNLSLFAEKVLPALHTLPNDLPTHATPFSKVRESAAANR